MSVKFIDVKEPVLKKGKHYLTSDYKTRGTRKTHNGMDMIGANRSIDDVIAIDDGKVIHILRLLVIMSRFSMPIIIFLVISI